MRPSGAPQSFLEGGTMSDTVGVAGDRIRSFVERIEQLDTELQELNEQKKEVFAEAKGEGFDVKILKEIIKLRKQDQEERGEHERGPTLRPCRGQSRLARRAIAALVELYHVRTAALMGNAQPDGKRCRVM